MRRTRTQFWRRTVSTLLALLLAMQALPAALAADAAEETEEIAAGTTPEEEGTESGEPQEPADAPEDMPGNDPLDDPEDTPQEPAEDGLPSSGTPNGSTGMEAEDGNEGTGQREVSSKDISENKDGSVTWTYDSETQTVTISGSGNTADYASKNYPGLDYADQIVTLKVEAGVTGLGKNLLRATTNLKNVSLPNTLLSIGENAFRGCSQLESITIPGSVTNLGRTSFYDDKALQNFVWENDPGNVGGYEMGDWIFCNAQLKVLKLLDIRLNY